jgi:hypothetical protein
MLSMHHLRQIIGPGHCPDDNTAAMPAITAIRTTPRHILLPPEAATTPPAVAAFDVQSHSIDKHGLVLISM